MRTGYWVSKHRKGISDINTSKNNNVIPERSGEIKPIQYTRLLFGLALWSILFLPVTFWMVLPLVSSVDNQIIEQSVPTGPIASIETNKLSDMSNKIIFGALPFNMFYGLLTAIIINSLSQNYLHKKNIDLRTPAQTNIQI